MRQKSWAGLATYNKCRDICYMSRQATMRHSRLHVTCLNMNNVKMNFPPNVDRYLTDAHCLNCRNNVRVCPALRKKYSRRSIFKILVHLPPRAEGWGRQRTAVSGTGSAGTAGNQRSGSITNRDQAIISFKVVIGFNSFMRLLIKKNT